jgi:hypothetical protein
VIGDAAVAGLGLVNGALVNRVKPLGRAKLTVSIRGGDGFVQQAIAFRLREIAGTFADPFLGIAVVELDDRIGVLSNVLESSLAFVVFPFCSPFGHLARSVHVGLD